MTNGFRFGRFELDPRARELRKDGIRLRLQDQPFEVLLTMLQQPGEVLTRDELRSRLWPDGTFVDFEHGLNAAVKRLRTALGDQADRPRFVETLHRRGYRFIGTVERVEADESQKEGKRRLAVVPFKSLGEANDHEYFTEGLTEEMITKLGRLCSDRLGVVARTSSMLARRNGQTARQIGQMLHVDYLVEGSVRREADRVRITVQLVETRGEMQLWAESYERHLADCFLVQSQVATEIAHALAMELLPDSRAKGSAGTRHVGAHQAYLKGRYHWNKAADEGLLEAIAFYEQALALDPAFAAAYASLGRAHVAMADYYLQEPRVALEAGRVAATRALELDPSESDAHLTLAEVRKIADRDWDAAEAEYRFSLAINPSSEAAYRLYGMFLAGRGRSLEAASALDRACDLDPLCLVVNTSAAWVRYLARDYDEAIDRCRHTLDMDPQFGPARRVLAGALVQAGRLGEALSELERATASRPDKVTLAWLAHAAAIRGDTERAIGVLAALERAGQEGYVSGYHRALAHTALGNIGEACGLLEASAEARDPAIINLAVEPRFEPLRADPRYCELIKQLELQNGQH